MFIINRSKNIIAAKYTYTNTQNFLSKLIPAKITNLMRAIFRELIKVCDHNSNGDLVKYQ